MRTAVDSSVLLDVLGGDPIFGERSRLALKDAYDAGSLIASDVVWAEVSAAVPAGAEPGVIFRRLGIEFEPLSVEAAEVAGRKWRTYRSRGGARKDRMVADFLIGAHASLQAEVLLTRDRGFFRVYFPELKIVDPSSR
ncbi:MAG: type II toxin-antitoxin system VapC family toxin [Thermoanaerobaculia bacterium]